MNYTILVEELTLVDNVSMTVDRGVRLFSAARVRVDQRAFHTTAPKSTIVGVCRPRDPCTLVLIVTSLRPLMRNGLLLQRGHTHEGSRASVN